jgi:hypothetical protein
MTQGRNGFRTWTWSKGMQPDNFVCGYAGLPHLAERKHAATYRCESEETISDCHPPPALRFRSAFARIWAIAQQHHDRAARATRA